MIHVNRALLCILFTFFIPEIHAQVIGGNGEGLTMVVSPGDIQYLQDITAVHPIAIRWPGGGDSKLAFPSLDKSGLGLNKDSIEILYQKFRDPKGNVKEESMTKDLRQAENDAKRPQSSLMDLIMLSKQVGGLQVDYCLNVLQGSVESNISAIRTLIDSGVNVISIVAGNETFYTYLYNFENYRKDFEPILRACEKEFPSIPRFLCIGQEIHKKDHITWNNAVFNYMKSTGDFISGVDVHYYLMEELKEAISLHPAFITYKPDSSYAALDKAFAKYVATTKSDQGLREIVNYLHQNIPGKKYHCTEFGDKHAEYWSNTIANGGRIFSLFCEYRNDFDILLVHNLIANWFWAARRPVGKLDLNPTGEDKINRVQWYAVQMANELPYETPALQKKITIDAPGTYYFYFNNVGEKNWEPEIITGNHSIISFQLSYVAGQHTYSSAGQTGFMDKNSEPSLEITGINTYLTRKIQWIPENSFGYVKIVVE